MYIYLYTFLRYCAPSYAIMKIILYKNLDKWCVRVIYINNIVWLLSIIYLITLKFLFYLRDYIDKINLLYTNLFYSSE